MATPVRLSAYFTHYLSQFESLAYQRCIMALRFFFSKNTLGKLDKEKCRQLVYNLLSNAFKFTQTGGAVKVAVKMEGGQLQLEVSDTGKGIHPDDLPHVFDRYFQTNRPDAPATGGTGIGLALCQEYARLFGGQISVESELGKGTVFKVAFPVEEVKVDILEEDLSNELISTFKEVKEKPDQFQAAPTAPPATGKKPTILVVEDGTPVLHATGFKKTFQRGLGWQRPRGTDPSC
ncbi:MAG: ATP-binding protein [Saprospiraceae bacterium]